MKFITKHICILLGSKYIKYNSCYIKAIRHCSFFNKEDRK